MSRRLTISGIIFSWLMLSIPIVYAEAFVAGLKWAFWMMTGILLAGIILAVIRGERKPTDSDINHGPRTTKSTSA